MELTLRPRPVIDGVPSVHTYRTAHVPSTESALPGNRNRRSIRGPHRFRRRDLAVAAIEAQRPLHEEADPLLQRQGLEIAPREPLARRCAARRQVDVIETSGRRGGSDGAGAGGGVADTIEQAHALVTPTPSRPAATVRMMLADKEARRGPVGGDGRHHWTNQY